MTYLASGLIAGVLVTWLARRPTTSSRGLAVVLAVVVVVVGALVTPLAEHRADLSLGFAIAVTASALVLLRDQRRRPRASRR